REAESPLRVRRHATAEGGGAGHVRNDGDPQDRVLPRRSPVGAVPHGCGGSDGPYVHVFAVRGGAGADGDAGESRAFLQGKVRCRYWSCVPAGEMDGSQDGTLRIDGSSQPATKGT